MAPKMKVEGTKEATDAAVWGLLALLRLGPLVFWVVKAYYQNNVNGTISPEKTNKANAIA